MKYPYILFDLDGTLIDTNELIMTSFMYSLNQVHPDVFTREQVLAVMGKPLREMMEHFDPQRADELVEIYLEHNLRHHDEYVSAFPHVLEVVKELHENAYRMALVTTKRRTTAQRGLTLTGLDAYIPHAICLEDSRKHKPDPEPLQMAMKLIDADPQKTIMIGDNSVDILGAKNAGVASCGVAWSMRGKEHLREYAPDFLIDDIRELLAIVK